MICVIHQCVLCTNRYGVAPGFVNYKKGCTRLAAASDKVYQLLAHGRWFSPDTLASSTTKTIDIAEILQKVVLNTINQSTNQSQTDMVHALPFIQHSSIFELSNCIDWIKFCCIWSLTSDWIKLCCIWSLTSDWIKFCCIRSVTKI